MSAAGDLIVELAGIARAQGLTKVSCGTGEISVELTVGSLPLPSTSPAGTLLPLSMPTNTDENGDKAERIERIARYKDAVESAHINGYPNAADYGLSELDVA